MRSPWLIVSFVFLSCGGNEMKMKSVSYDEGALKNFVLTSRNPDETTSLKRLDSVLVDASNDSVVFRKTISYLETPFSNPNSSYRNQDLYSKLLESEIDSKWYSGYEKQVAAGKLKLLEQNNVGNAANDFTYITPAGYKKKMYDVKADFLLLYFNNPECPACKEMKASIIASPVITQKLKEGQLKVLSIYTDPDEKLWLSHLNEYPEFWLQGRDENEYLYKHRVYDLRAIPTIYLLDKYKKVLLKDCTDVHEIEKVLGKK